MRYADDLSVIQHHGIVGMHWGRRKNTKIPEGVKPFHMKKTKAQKGIEKQNEIQRRVVQSKAAEMQKNFESMTSQELQSQLNRLNLQKQLVQTIDSTSAMDSRTIARHRDTVLSVAAGVLDVATPVIATKYGVNVAPVSKGIDGVRKRTKS